MAEQKFLGLVLVKASGDPRQVVPDLFKRDPQDRTMRHLLEFHDELHPEDAPHRWERAVTDGVEASDPELLALARQARENARNDTRTEAEKIKDAAAWVCDPDGVARNDDEVRG